ncbi:GPI ethanolamine phosphate transferase 3 [Bienertia sinuspersici]
MDKHHQPLSPSALVWPWYSAFVANPAKHRTYALGLTTGGLPTFIDVGNSFGAPAIVEDNFIQQLVENGKRVVMMGDDTWLQLFPHHFEKSFPYPSFNVKDLDTVDNGCIEHLIPSLREGNWDVLIAHFLGVDHTGHIFGVNTMPMIHKLEQYNSIVECSVRNLEDFIASIKSKPAATALASSEGALDRAPERLMKKLGNKEGIETGYFLILTQPLARTPKKVGQAGSGECEKPEVVGALTNLSGPGGLHENTFMVVMGDHGQTLNGDHGGGSPEEVETSIFAMSFNNVTSSLPPELDSVTCGLNADAKELCISTIEQLDFAATMSAMLGVPFPFGSIGRVNPQLYSLGAGTSLSQGIQVKGHGNDSSSMKWMHHYVNSLCINAWQVKRYIDVYSASSVIGFPSEDLLHVADIYSLAQENWLHVVKGSLSCTNESCPSFHSLKRQIDMYVQFLDRVIGLARSKWTEFNLKLMLVGLGIIFLSLLVQVFAIKRVGKFNVSSLSNRCPQASVGLFFLFLQSLLERAVSFQIVIYVSVNPFIYSVLLCVATPFCNFDNILAYLIVLTVEEGKVAVFLLGTSVILKLRNSFKEAMMLLEVCQSLLGLVQFCFLFSV